MQVQTSSIYTKYSIRDNLGLSGSCYLITEISYTKAMSRVDILCTLLDNSGYWKYIPIVITLMNQKGIKIVVMVTRGNLYSGISKWAYLNGFTIE
jgi:hypothetical protein